MARPGGEVKRRTRPTPSTPRAALLPPRRGYGIHESRTSRMVVKAAAGLPSPLRGGAGGGGRAGCARASCRAASTASRHVRAPALPVDPHPSASPPPSPQGGRKARVDAASSIRHVGAREITTTTSPPGRSERARCRTRPPRGPNRAWLPLGQKAARSHHPSASSARMRAQLRMSLVERDVMS